MNTLTQQQTDAAPRRWPGWLRAAWHGLGWRHAAVSVLLAIVWQAAGPLGGAWLLPFDLPSSKLASLMTTLLFHACPLVFGTLVADRAIADGVRPLRAYASILLVVASGGPVLEWHFQRLAGIKNFEAPQMIWWALAILMQGGLGLTIYARWRETQRAAQRLQAIETGRLDDERRVRLARLRALQARVEPQLLFDALSRIGSLHAFDPATADGLLANLIVLLRAMLPRAETAMSDVAQEFALADAYVRVARLARVDVPVDARELRQRVAPAVGEARLAPMLVLPLLQAALRDPTAWRLDWTLSADVEAGVLHIELGTPSGAGPGAPLDPADMAALSERLAQLHGDAARLVVEPGAAAATRLILLMPLDHDDRPDR